MGKADYSNIMSFLESGILPSALASTKSNFRKKANKFEIKNGKLYRAGLPVVQVSEQKRIFDSILAILIANIFTTR